MNLIINRRKQPKQQINLSVVVHKFCSQFEKKHYPQILPNLAMQDVGVQIELTSILPPFTFISSFFSKYLKSFSMV